MADERLELMNASISVKEQLADIRDVLGKVNDKLDNKVDKSDLDKQDTRIAKLENRLNGILIGVGSGIAIGLIAFLRGMLLP